MNQHNIGKFISELRKEKKLTQSDLADILNVNVKSISRWETGRNMPDISTLLEISKYFNVSISELIKGEKSTSQNDTTKDIIKYTKAEQDKMINKLSNYGVALISIFIFITLININNISATGWYIYFATIFGIWISAEIIKETLKLNGVIEISSLKKLIKKILPLIIIMVIIFIIIIKRRLTI